MLGVVTHHGGENAFAFCLLKTQFSYTFLQSLHQLLLMHLNVSFPPAHKALQFNSKGDLLAKFTVHTACLPMWRCWLSSWQRRPDPGIKEARVFVRPRIVKSQGKLHLSPHSCPGINLEGENQFGNHSTNFCKINYLFCA